MLDVAMGMDCKNRIAIIFDRDFRNSGGFSRDNIRRHIIDMVCSVVIWPKSDSGGNEYTQNGKFVSIGAPSVKFGVFRYICRSLAGNRLRAKANWEISRH